MKHTLIPIVCLLLLPSLVLAGEFIDSFAGNDINSEAWRSFTNGGISVYQQNALHISGISTDSSPNWLAGAGVICNQAFPISGFEVVVNMNVVGSGTGWWSGISVWDGALTNTALNYFISRHPSQPPRVGYAYTIYGSPLVGVWLSNTCGNELAMRYQDGSLSFYMDGNYLGNQILPLSSVVITLEGYCRTSGDAINAEFNNLRIQYSTVPELPNHTTLLLAYCFVGVSNTLRRYRRR